MLWALPTWFMTNLMSPFLPRGHPWRGRWFRLREWYNGRQPLAVVFDSLFWGVILPLWLTGLLLELARR